MNLENTHPDEAIWAYLHGELDDAARAVFEQRLVDDGALRVRCEQARRLDGTLHAALPALDTASVSDAALAEQALAAWERDQDIREPAAPATRSVAARVWRFRSLTAGCAALAAALLVFAAYPLLRPPQAGPWAPVTFVPLVTRGPAAASRPALLRAQDAKRAQEALADSLAWALADCGGTLPANLSLVLQVRELTDGAFSAMVRAELPDGRLLGEWSGDYSSLGRFMEDADASAARLAEAIAVPPAAAGGPRPRPGE